MVPPTPGTGRESSRGSRAVKGLVATIRQFDELSQIERKTLGGFFLASGQVDGAAIFAKYRVILKDLTVVLLLQRHLAGWADRAGRNPAAPRDDPSAIVSAG